MAFNFPNNTTCLL